MLYGGCRDDEVRLREGVSNLAAFFDQQPPPEHYVFGNRKNPAIEHRPHLVSQPVVQFGPAIGFGYEFNPKANFGKSDGTDVQALNGAIGHKGYDLRFRPCRRSSDN